MQDTSVNTRLTAHIMYGYKLTTLVKQSHVARKVANKDEP